jgi:hypothetical protein
LPYLCFLGVHVILHSLCRGFYVTLPLFCRGSTLPYLCFVKGPYYPTLSLSGVHVTLPLFCWGFMLLYTHFVGGLCYSTLILLGSMLPYLCFVGRPCYLCFVGVPYYPTFVLSGVHVTLHLLCWWSMSSYLLLCIVCFVDYDHVEHNVKPVIRFEIKSISSLDPVGHHIAILRWSLYT